MIAAAVHALHEPGSCLCLWVKGHDRKRLSCYYTDHAKLAVEAASLNGEYVGVYTTCNPVDPDLLPEPASTRLNRHVSKYVKPPTNDMIAAHRLLLIDVDSGHPVNQRHGPGEAGAADKTPPS